MRKYNPVEVTEKQLEDLVRQGPDLIEDGLRFVDHQRTTDRGPLDVLLVDSGNALVVAELKVIEDESMLMQGVDYYDYLSRNIEGIARAYKDYNVDPGQPIRLFLVAPGFSVSLMNRCKWIEIPISLFSYKCIKYSDSEDITPIFLEVMIPSVPKPVVNYKLEDNLKYITNPEARKLVDCLIIDVKGWDSGKILVEPIKADISVKFSGRVFLYICPRRKHFMVYTYDNERKWTGYQIHQKDDLEKVKILLRQNVEKYK